MGPVDRVAIAASSFAPHRGGVEELVAQLAREQQTRGGHPTVLTMRWPTDLPARETIDGVPVRRFVYRAPEGRLRHRALGLATTPTVIGAAATELRRSGAELVHIQCVSSAAWFVEKAARLARVPLVVSLQGELTMDATGVYDRSAFLRSTLRHLLRTADAITACSRHTLHEAEEWAGFDLGERASVVHNGVRLSDFDLPEAVEDGAPDTRARPYVFAVGRHVHQKGFDVLLDAFASLVADPGFTWDLVLAGDGTGHAALVAQCHRLGLGGRVTLCGATDRARTAALFRGCSLFVLPSRHEPFGIVNLEAMAAGRPLVATEVGGVPEFVIDGETGVLVAAENAPALAAAISNLHDHPATAARMGVAGRARAEEFDWSRIEDRYEQVYGEALERYRSRRQRAPGRSATTSR